jgi:Protein of unknown function (DUF3551)
MHSKILTLVVVSAALIGATELTSAQSPYSYSWCSRQGGRYDGATSCYFTSYQQCMTTISGIGGYCYQNPSYHASAATPLRSRRPHR